MNLIDCCNLFQCRGGEDGSVHQPLHRAGADAVRGRGGPLPDCPHTQDTAHIHGPDRGRAHIHAPDRGRAHIHAPDRGRARIL